MEPQPPTEPFDSTRNVAGSSFGRLPTPDDSTVFLSKSQTPPAEESQSTPPSHVDQYEVVRALGRGGMGEVFLAHDPILKRRIALKRIRPDRRDDQEPRDRFANEARITAMLQHPSIIPVYSFASVDEDMFYTMRPVEGLTLAEIFSVLRRNEEGIRDEWTVARLVRLFLQATGAMAFAHSRGVIHRDLKPANIMLGPFEEVLVLDWGLAKIVESGDSEPEPSLDFNELEGLDAHTASRMLIGTAGYIPRENLEHGVAPSQQSDLFALGVILYELLALRPPWEAKSVRELTQAMRSVPPSPVQLQPSRDIPSALAQVALRAIHPDPEKRYESVTQFAHDVAHAIEGRATWQPVESAQAGKGWRLYEGRRKVEEDTVLTFHSSGRNQEFVYVYTLPLFGVDLRIEFDFMLRKGAHQLSVVMNCPNLRKRDELKGYSLQLVSRRKKGLALLRNGRDVAGSRAPEYKQKKWYRATLERRDEHFSVLIDGEPLYDYSDPIPLRGGYLSLLGSSLGLGIRDLKLWSRGASSTVSCLAVPDAFFNHELYEKARTEYQRIASSLTGRREGRLAGFRAGLCTVEMARKKRNADLRDRLLLEAKSGFVALGRVSPSCLSNLGRGIVASETGAIVEMRDALREALTEHPEDPQLGTVHEWLLTYLHGRGEGDRHMLAECLPLAVGHCLETGLRVVRDLVHRVRASWEIPSFLTGRLQGKVSDPTFRAETELFCGFWAARPGVIGAAARELADSDRFRPYHVTDAIFAMLELTQVEQARELLELFDSLAVLSPDRIGFEIACRLCRAALLAQEGDLPAAEEILSEVEFDPNDRGYNTARLAVAHAEYRAGRYAQLFEILRGSDRFDAFAREHRAWFRLQLGDRAAAAKEIEPSIDRGSHERGRNLTNFLHGLCLIGADKVEEACEVFEMLPFPRYPRTWTLGSHYASGRLTGDRFEEYLKESFPWERKQLFSQMALLSRARGDNKSFKSLLEKSQTACCGVGS